MSAIALRPFLPADGSRCAAIFKAAVEVLTEEDYDADQRAAWARRADDVKALTEQLDKGLTLVAAREGRMVGFASLKDNKLVDMLYVDPDAARRGVATALLDALMRIAAGRGAGKLTADVSETALPLFRKFGFAPERRNIVALDDEWLANTTMSKTLSAAPAEPKPTAH